MTLFASIEFKAMKALSDISVPYFIIIYMGKYKGEGKTSPLYLN